MVMGEWDMLSTRKYALLLAALPIAVHAGPAKIDAQNTLVASWSASPSPRKSPFSSIDVKLHNQTLRQHVTLSKGGSAVRVTLSNVFGAKPVHIGGASILCENTGQFIPLRFGGALSADMAAGAPLVSDLASCAVADASRLEIRLYLPGDVTVDTLHEYGLTLAEASSPGDFTQGKAFPEPTPVGVSPDRRLKGKAGARPFLTEVDVLAHPGTQAIVTFGDSITDGAGSTPDVDRRWPDVLWQRIHASKLPFSVVNEGISGNQILGDGLGVNALARFDRDVLAKPGARSVIILEGINDIGFSGGMVPGFSPPDTITAQAIITGYDQLIARAHGRGLRVIGGTMTPWQGSPAFTPAKEAVRQAVNDWLRKTAPLDGVIDFDMATRDPGDPARLARTFDSGDHIHPNDAGYAAMAAAIDLKIL
jgi:lysophospholipase L1-like esterase